MGEINMQKLKVWEDVLDETLDMQVAPELGDVINKTAHKIYTEPEEFFKRTYFTDSMVQILNRLLNTLSGEERHNIFLIYSLFGGGKTHTILTIYHAINNPNSLTDESTLKDYPEDKKEMIKGTGIKLKILQNQNIKILPIYGKGKLGQPSNPLNFGAYEVKTLWGYIGHCLGKYSVVENDDKNLTVPTIDTIRELLKGNKVVFLVDEIVHYIDNLYNSGNEDDRRYAKNICKFFDALCTALIGTDSIMVLTLPMEKDGEKVEKGYNREIVLSLHRAVERVGGAELYSPLRTEGISGGEIVEILKKRIFEDMDKDFKERIIEKYRESYSNTGIFGRFEENLSNTYPFHPDYIATLRTIVERGNLQKTRDMVRITRIVIRNLLQEEEFPTLIMPYHINPRNEKLKGILFGKNQIFADYGGAVLDVDLSLEKFKRFSKPELAEVILRYIFLKTYPYDSPTPLEGFPKKDSIARAVYEINFFEKHALQLTDIPNTISEIEKSSSFIYLNKKDGIFWFWRVANVSQMVESKKEELLTLNIVSVYRKLEEFVKKIAIEGRGLRTRKIGNKVSFFKKGSVVVSRDPQEFQDNADYKLQILIRDDVDKSLLKRVIYHYGTGTRTYRNTITVCYADKSLNKLLEITARIMACEKVKGDIKAKYKSYGEEVVQIQTNMVRSIEDDAKAGFDESAASVFIAFCICISFDNNRYHFSFMLCYFISKLIKEICFNIINANDFVILHYSGITCR
jgi:predicted AAA+ superfamily ATPase